MWEDVEGQESFHISPGFELTTRGLLVQEHTTQPPHTAQDIVEAYSILWPFSPFSIELIMPLVNAVFL